MMKNIMVGTRVLARGHDGRFEVVGINGSMAKIKLLANKKDTGEAVDINYVQEVPISTLTPYELEKP